MEVLNKRERLIEMVQKGAPFLVLLGLPEADRVVVELLPLNEQKVCARRLDRTRQRETSTPGH